MYYIYHVQSSLSSFEQSCTSLRIYVQRKKELEESVLYICSLFAKTREEIYYTLRYSIKIDSHFHLSL